MASRSAIIRLSSKLSTRNVRRKVVSRGFSGCTTRYDASNFTMPAMSPTMTEGNISSWKFKEGDSYSTGDVLLEIETDKAQMDVEATEDGVLFKIIQGDGTKGVQVGSRIAVTAEQGDDLSTLEVPKEDPVPSKEGKNSQESSASEEASSKPPKREEETRQQSTKQSAHEETSQPSSSSSSVDTHISQPQKYPLYPSVQALLHLHNISISDADKIPASGPSGRLLKGDVLAYVGNIDKSYASKLSEQLHEREKLDLSNIKIMETVPPPKEADKAAEQEGLEDIELDTELAIPISLSAVLSTQRRIKDSLGLVLPLSTFIARACEIANEELPRGRSTPPTQGELFDAVLGLDKIKGPPRSRGAYIPQVTALPRAEEVPRDRTPRPPRKVDIIDMLSGSVPKTQKAPPAAVLVPGAAGVGSAGAENVFSVSVKPGDERRARIFLERMKSVLEAEPGRLVL